MLTGSEERRTARGERTPSALARAVAAGAAALGIAAVAVLSPAAPARADVDDFDFASLTVDYYLTTDAEGGAVLGVVERWVADFPAEDQNRGIVRSIPRYDDGRRLDTTVIDVSDENGDPVDWVDETSAGDSEVELSIDDDTYKHGEHTYVISYTMDDVIRGFDDGDEFYPNVTAGVSEQPVHAVDAALHVDASLTGALDGRAECFTGAYGDRGGDCSIATTTADDEGSDAPPSVFTGTAVADGDWDGAAVVEVAGGPLEAGDGLSFVVGFAPGTFVLPPPGPETGVGFGSGILSGVLALAAAVVALVVRRRDEAALPRPRVVQYTPPRGVSPGVAAMVLGARRKALAAGVLDLAVRGLLDVRESAGGRFRLAPSEGAPAGREPSEADIRLLKAVLGKKRSSPLSLPTSSARVGRRLDAEQRALRSDAETAGYVVRQGRASTTVRRGMLVASGAAALLAAVLAIGSFVPWWLPLACLAVVAVACVVDVRLSPRNVTLTDAGRALTQYLLGLRAYIALAEADRLRYLQSPETAELRRVGTVDPDDAPERPHADAAGDDASAADDADDAVWRLHLHERLLPYAVLFGLEKRWAQELASLSAEVPEAARTPGLSYDPMRTAVLVSGIHAASTHTSTPSSGASSSGFSSGGFSGGGFGGGGVGGR